MYSCFQKKEPLILLNKSDLLVETFCFRNFLGVLKFADFETRLLFIYLLIHSLKYLSEMKTQYTVSNRSYMPANLETQNQWTVLSTKRRLQKYLKLR
jgi:hypothetical protein